MTNNNSATTVKGRERICTQCGATYRAKRSTSTYCSQPCRQKGNRGTPAKVLKTSQWSPITKALHKVGYVGISGPLDKTSEAPKSYSLTVPYDLAYSELSYHFSRKGWGNVSREEFSEALRKDGIEAFYKLSDDAISHKLERDRGTQQLRRQS